MQKITFDDVRQSIADQYGEDVLEGMNMFTGPDYAAAIVAVTHDYRLVYDYEKMAQCLMDDDGMSYEEATEFLDYNVIRTLPYMEKAPVIIMPLEIVALERERERARET